MLTGLTFAIACGVLAIIYGAVSIAQILNKPAGSEAVQKIALAIQQGASAYLKRQYITIGLVGVVLFVVIWIALDHFTAIGFALGAVFSGLAGFIGMHVSVRANSRTATAAASGINAALQIEM